MVNSKMCYERAATDNMILAAQVVSCVLHSCTQNPQKKMSSTKGAKFVHLTINAHILGNTSCKKS